MLTISGLLHAVAQPVPPGAIYIALGDSIAAGIGSSLPRDRAYPTLIGERLAAELKSPVRTENLAIPGESAASFPSSTQLEELRTLIDEIETSQLPIEVVTLSLGGNELLEIQDSPLADREAALESFESAFPATLELIRSVVGQETRVFVSTIYDPTGGDPAIEHSDAWWIDQFNDVIRNAGNADGVSVVDLADAFGEEAAKLTRYPVDVHPTNAGHARIAAAHWQAMGYDEQAPEIEVTSSTDASRLTPTIRFNVSPDTDGDSIEISTEADIVIFKPVEITDGEFVALIDASAARPESVVLSITASDVAGNSSNIETVVTFPVTS